MVDDVVPSGFVVIADVTASKGEDQLKADITTRQQINGIDLSASEPVVLTDSGTHELSTIRAILDD